MSYDILDGIYLKKNEEGYTLFMLLRVSNVYGEDGKRAKTLWCEDIYTKEDEKRIIEGVRQSFEDGTIKGGRIRTFNSFLKQYEAQKELIVMAIKNGAW